MNEFMAVSIKHGLRTTDCGLGIKYGLVKCMVNKALLLLLKDSPRSRGEIDVSPSITFKITAKIEIRKHELMCCILLRGGFVSALYRICYFIAMKCVYIVFYCQ